MPQKWKKLKKIGGHLGFLGGHFEISSESISNFVYYSNIHLCTKFGACITKRTIDVLFDTSNLHYHKVVRSPTKMKVGIAKLREAPTKMKGIPAKYKCYKGSVQSRKGVCNAEGGLV